MKININNKSKLSGDEALNIVAGILYFNRAQIKKGMGFTERNGVSVMIKKNEKSIYFELYDRFKFAEVAE